MQAKLQEQLTADDAATILARLPQRIQEAFTSRAEELEYPIEAVLEMANTTWSEATASFLDTEALSFVDCKPGRGQ